MVLLYKKIRAEIYTGCQKKERLATFLMCGFWKKIKKELLERFLIFKYVIIYLTYNDFLNLMWPWIISTFRIVFFKYKY